MTIRKRGHSDDGLVLVALVEADASSRDTPTDDEQVHFLRFGTRMPCVGLNVGVHHVGVRLAAVPKSCMADQSTTEAETGADEDNALHRGTETACRD